MNTRSAKRIACLTLWAASALSSTASAQGLAKLVPGNSWLHMEFTGATCAAHGQDLEIAKLFNEPEVQKFLAPIMQWAHEPEQMGMINGGLAMVGLELSDLKPLLRARIAVTLLPPPNIEQGPQNSGPPEVVVALDFGPEAEAGFRLADAVGEAMETAIDGEVAEVEFAGVRGIQIRPEWGQGLCWCKTGTMVLAATTPDALSQVVRLSRGENAETSLASSTGWKACAPHHNHSKSLVSGFVNLEPIFAMIASFAPEPVFQMLGDLKAMSYSFELDGNAFKDRMFVWAPNPQGFMKTALAKPNRALTGDRLAPRDAVMFSSSAFDATGLMEALRGLASMDPSFARQMDRALEMVKSRTGVDLEKDLLPLLGTEMAYWAALPGHSLIPDLVVSLPDTRSPDVLDGHIRKLVGLNPKLEIRDLDYLGSKLSYVDLASLGMRFDRMPPLKPTWAFIEGHGLVIAPWPQAAKKLIRDLKEGAPRLASNDDYKTLLARLAQGDANVGTHSRAYLDVRRLWGFLMDNGAPLAQSLIPDLPAEAGLRVEWGDFPMTETITRHLMGTVAVTSPVDGGVKVEALSSAGVLPIYVATVAGVGAAMAVGMRQSMELEVMGGPAIGLAEALEEPVPDEEHEHGHNHQPAPLPSAKRVTAQAELVVLKDAVKLHQLRERSLPPASAWPKWCIEGTALHPTPYVSADSVTIKNGQILDPWGNPYVYKLEEQKFEIMSYGADGQPGGEGENADLSTNR